MTTMLYLAYSFETTAHAQANPDAFWAWMADRHAWFYNGLDMVRATSWRTESRPTSQLIHHEVAFDDERGLAGYRAVLAARGRDPGWEARRRSQDTWYTIVSRSVQVSPPVPMTTGQHPDPAEEGALPIA
ncbi:hypothetical protein ACH4Y0_02030 [Streptomyces sp. NPDC020707]|uniref:hypothetical protein n=1 Tax=Streptomyces sp. NPDC020707 TaxID=3365084 RepID=UPI0037A1DED7